MVVEFEGALEEIIKLPVGVIEEHKVFKYAHVKLVAQITDALGDILEDEKLSEEFDRLLVESGASFLAYDKLKTSIKNIYLVNLDWTLEQVKIFGTKQQKEAYLNKKRWVRRGM